MTLRKKVFLSLAAAVALVIAAGGVAAWKLWPGLRAWATEQAGAATGRDVEIAGGMSLDLISWTPSLVANDVRLSNPDWATAENMATARRLAFAVDLRDLLRGHVRVTGLRLEGAELMLEEDGQGRGNWSFGAEAGDAAAVKEAAIPEDRTEAPTVERLEIVDARLVYASPKLTEPIEARFETLVLDNRPDGIAVETRGTYQEQPFHIVAKGGGFGLLREAKAPYPLDVAVEIGDTAAKISGTMADPVRFLGFDARMSLSGRTLADLYEILGIPLPSSPAYELAGRLVSAEGLWRLQGFEGRLGGSDMRGTIAVETGRAVPLLRADVTSNALRMQDLQGFLGEDDAEGRRIAAEAPSDEGLLPTEPFNLQKMRTMDAEVTFVGKRIASGETLLDDVSTTFTLRGGRLTMDPVRFGVAGGSIAGRLVVDAAQRVPRLDADLRLRRLDFGKLMKDVDPQQVTTGRIGGRIDVAARGRSVREMALNAEGRMLAYMAGGTIGNTILELVELDFPQVIADLFGGGEVWPINCAILPVSIGGGQLRTQRLILDATHDTVVGTGVVDLASERMEFQLTGKPRDFSLFNTPSVITIRGSLTAGEVGVDTGQAIMETVKKLLAVPIAPFMEDDGGDEDLRACQAVENAQGATGRRTD